MKVITGIFKNKNLFLPNKENLNIKPISSKIKEAIYNLIQFNLNEKKVLDLFAGSGQLGVEALSRGAKYVLFIDNSYESIKLIKKNTHFVTDKSLYDILMLHYNTFLNKYQDKFDIIFLDPPYHKNILNNIFKLNNINILNQHGMIICKYHINEKFTLPNNYLITKEKIYGNNKITIIKKII